MAEKGRQTVESKAEVFNTHVDMHFAESGSRRAAGCSTDCRIDDGYVQWIYNHGMKICCSFCGKELDEIFLNFQGGERCQR